MGKSERNKTIQLTEEEKKSYLLRCTILGENQKLDKPEGHIILGDSVATLKKLPRQFVDLLIVDPPYNLTKQYASTRFTDKTTREYETYTREWIESVLPLLKPNASVYVCADWRISIVIGQVLESYFILQNRITWQREKGRGALSNWKNGMEDIWFATMSNEYCFNVDAVKIRRRVVAPYRVDGKPKDWVEGASGNFRDTHPSNFWDDVTIPYWSMPENTVHPTQKPEKLVAKLILASSSPGDVVLDPFLGSGTTAVVAKKLGRQFVGIEREAEYCAIAQKRLELAEKDNCIQGYTDHVFWERNTLTEQMKKILGNPVSVASNTNQTKTFSIV